MLSNKTVVLGVTGSIAAYKTASLASALKKLHCDVHVIMTKNAAEIITPLTFERLTGNKCMLETFDKINQFEVEHIAIAQKADLFMVAPATANIIGKVANGIADDMLSTTIMATKAPVYFAPAMNTNMYTNPIFQDNMERLENFGYHMITPATGYLACGDTGIGKMPEPDTLLQYIIKELAYEKDLAGKKVLVTAGATCEDIDPVRYITNRSTGKMGISIAKAAMLRGAEVTLVKAKTDVEPPMFVDAVDVRSAEDMFNAVTQRFNDCDIVIKAAAVADYTPANVADEKIKKKDGDISIELDRTKDILKYLGEHKKNQFICGFSMETENMLENSQKKLKSKNADMIAANSLRTAGAGFGTDTNVLTLITKDGAEELPLMSKDDAAHKIFDKILKIIK
ncbi:MAG: bifunctional phosphopantothenoylcysteine decarboxylase/phosphopantothenate--cysteine ligase CoaBC [Firmicutes bacterium]|nr:bifunctional phosphopantothenoylcysteine decarboxylase/phosphopantothenate--cysteine ligase CoaBC [Bacillota bacterium]